VAGTGVLTPTQIGPEISTSTVPLTAGLLTAVAVIVTLNPYAESGKYAV
jgi:hypothetical protein